MTTALPGACSGGGGNSEDIRRIKWVCSIFSTHSAEPPGIRVLIPRRTKGQAKQRVMACRRWPRRCWLCSMAAKRATSTIPIVMTAAGDPLGSGLVASLAQPGGNVTGMSLMAPDLGGKRLELLKELLPRLARVAVLWNAANPYSANVFKETQAAGRVLGVQVQSLGVRHPEDLDGAFEAARQQHPDALVSVEDPFTGSYRKRITDFAIASHLPSLHGLREDVDAGGLVSYGANLAELARRAAGYVDKILKGAKPADLPVQQPTRFELVINLKTARLLGLTVPPSLLARADEVIE
jgi:ABC-type uncharacterized transport system substrate-binding protein